MHRFVINRVTSRFSHCSLVMQDALEQVTSESLDLLPGGWLVGTYTMAWHGSRYSHGVENRSNVFTITLKCHGIKIDFHVLST